MDQEQQVYTSHGIQYMDGSTLVGHDEAWIRFEYTATFLETGRQVVDAIWVKKELDGFMLCAYWSRGSGWHYIPRL